MGKTQEKARSKRLIFILIPIIAFVIGYFAMVMIQTLKLDNWVFDRQDPPQLDFRVKDSGAIPGLINDTGSPIEGEVDIVISEQISFPTLDVYLVQVGTYATEESALKKINALNAEGFATAIYRGQVLRVFVAATIDEASADLLVKAYSEKWDALSIVPLTLEPAKLDLELHYDHGDTDKAIIYELQLLKEAAAYMSAEEIQKHTKSEKKIFIASQREGLFLLRDALRLKTNNTALRGVQENLLLMADRHEELVDQWSEDSLDAQQIRWRGILELMLQYPQIIR